MQAMPDPARLHLMDTLYAGHVLGGMKYFIDDAGLDTIEHAREYGFRRLPDDRKDRDCDQQPDDGIGKRKSKPYADGAHDHRQARETIGAGMIAIRDQRRAVDLASDTDTEYGNRLVSDEADDASRRDPAEKCDELRIDQPGDRLVACHDGAEKNDENDQDSGEIFNATQAIGECLAGFAAGQHERYPQWDGGGRVADIVDGVGQQGHASGAEHDYELKCRCNGQNDE